MLFQHRECSKKSSSIANVYLFCFSIWLQYCLQMPIGLQTRMRNFSEISSAEKMSVILTVSVLQYKYANSCGECFIHTEFYFKFDNDAHRQKEMRGRDDSVWCSLGHCHCHSGEYYSTVRLNSWPNLSLSVVSFPPSPCFGFENVFMKMHFIWQIWYCREISVFIFCLLIDYLNRIKDKFIQRDTIQRETI